MKKILTAIILPSLLYACAHDDHKNKISPEAKLESELRPSMIIEPGGGDHLWVFQKNAHELGSGGEFHIYIDPEKQPHARASFAKFSLGKSGALPAHKHSKTEEITYFLSGKGLAISFKDGKAYETPVSAGSVWYTPPGAWHALKNTGDEPLALIFAIIPNKKKGLLSFFRKIGTKPGETPIRLSPEDFGKIAAEHDLILMPAQK